VSVAKEAMFDDGTSNRIVGVCDVISHLLLSALNVKGNAKDGRTWPWHKDVG